MTNVSLTMKNLQDTDKKYTGKFLVDSGATNTVVTKQVLHKLGIKPQRTEKFSMADGTIIKGNVGSCLYEFQGIESAALVLFGEKGQITFRIYKLK